MLRVLLLGDLQVYKNGKELKKLGSKKARDLLLFLLLNKNAKVPNYEIFETFWDGYDETSARLNLNATLYMIRKAYGISSRHLYLSYNSCTLEKQNIETDIDELNKMLGDAKREKDKAKKMENLKNIVELYKGDLLQGMDESWIVFKREQIRKNYVEALCELADLYEDGDRKSEALDLLIMAFEMDKTRDDVWLKLIAMHVENENFIVAKKLFEEYKNHFTQEELEFKALSLKNIVLSKLKKEEKISEDKQGATILSEEHFQLLTNIEKNKRQKDYILLCVKNNDEEKIEEAFGKITQQIRKQDIAMKKENCFYIMFRDIHNIDTWRSDMIDKVKNQLESDKSEFQIKEIE